MASHIWHPGYLESRLTSNSLDSKAYRPHSHCLISLIPLVNSQRILTTAMENIPAPLLSVRRCLATPSKQAGFNNPRQGRSSNVILLIFIAGLLTLAVGLLAKWYLDGHLHGVEHDRYAF